MRGRPFGCIIATCTALAAGLAGCGDRTQLPPTAGSASPWTGKAFVSNAGDFQFAVVADRTGGRRAGVFPHAVEAINRMQPELVLSVGDLIDGYIDDRDEITAQWDEFDAMAARLDAPFFYVPGNHDITNNVMADVWRQRRGPAYYHFLYKGCLFLCLNSEDPPASQMSDAQVEYAVRALRDNRQARWVFVFLHKPFWAWTNRRELPWNRIEKALPAGRTTVFTGHNHKYNYLQRDGIDFYTLSVTGGGNSNSGAVWGNFDQFVWVTVRPNGPIVANVAADAVYPPDVYTAEKGEILSKQFSALEIQTAPILVDQPQISRFQTVLTLTNGSGKTAVYKGLFAPREGVAIEPAGMYLTIPAGESRQVPVSVTLAQTTDPEQFEPVKLEYSIAAEGPQGKTLTQERTLGLGVAQQRVARRATGTIAVDGDLSDWGELPVACEKPAQIHGKVNEWKGPADGSFRFDVRHDDKYLYIAVATRDDDVTVDPQKSPWNQDDIEVRLDARPDPQRSGNASRKSFDDIVALNLAVGASPDAPNCPELARNPKGTRIACRRTDTGLAAEIAIPVVWLNDKQGGPWKAVRLDVSMTDVDGESKTMLRWRPRWDGSGIAGSGTFLQGK